METGEAREPAMHSPGAEGMTCLQEPLAFAMVETRNCPCLQLSWLGGPLLLLTQPRTAHMLLLYQWNKEVSILSVSFTLAL